MNRHFPKKGTQKPIGMWKDTQGHQSEKNAHPYHNKTSSHTC